MGEANEYSHQLNLIKSIELVTALQKKEELSAFRYIEDYNRNLEWNLDALMIENEIWTYVSSTLKCSPQLVFCHPKILLDNGQTSRYYRNLCGLSLKAARTYFGAVETMERGNSKARLSDQKALKMAQTYNTFTCSIIRNSTDWTLENGHRTILATMGITLDGKMRNRIGEIAEDRVRRLILGWLIESVLMAQPKLTKDQLTNLEELPQEYVLKSGVTMRFAAEPDVTFSKDDEILAVIEIKGGVDPAGALERYGAAKKSFEHAVAKSPRCRNFYLAAVLTSELENRMRDDRLVERWFHIVRLLQSADHAELFFEELFHHSLRLV